MTARRDHFGRGPGARRHGNRGAAVANVIVLLTMTATALLAGELIVRVLFGRSINLFPRYHTAVTYGEYRMRRLRPNTVFWHTSRDGHWKFQTDSQGFRAAEDYAYEKPPGSVRVLALGDSQTMGFEVRQNRTYSAVIARWLASRGIDAQSINAGVSGFSTAEELVFLENEGIKYDPDFVVLGFFANDFADNVKAGMFRLDDGKLVEMSKDYAPGVGILDLVNSLAPLRWLSEHSYLYSAVLNSAWEGSKQILLSRQRANLTTEFAIPTEEVSNYEYDLAAALVERMYAFCRAHGIKLIILDIPKPTRKGFASSVPSALESVFRASSDAYLGSEQVLGPYADVAEILVPHGQRHMSEFSHLMFGISVASYVLDQIHDQPES
jgi:GDSL-like Lipase/Acylhydrolase family